jgi:hypothetical protein
VLDHLVIQTMDTSGGKKAVAKKSEKVGCVQRVQCMIVTCVRVLQSELSAIIRFGATDLFAKSGETNASASTTGADACALCVVWR